MSPKLDPTQIVERVEGGEMGAASSSEPEIGDDDDIGNVSNSITCAGSSFNSGNVNVNDSIVYEILSRLPVKSLMQFKCVSKHWCSMILRDRYFINLHLQQSKSRPCLFITVPRPRQDYKSYTKEKHDNTSYPLGYYLVTADLLFEGGEISAVVRNIREMDTPSYRILGPLNGLICLFDPEKNHSVQVCNLSTREVTPWIKSTFISSLNLEDTDKFRLRTSTCHLGFSPATKEHKVICFWNQVCEVLTVGDGNWRIIDDLPPYNYKHHYRFGASLYVNGSIYFYCPHKLPCVNTDDKPKYLVAFDVGEEKFRVIQIPNFILDQIPLTCEVEIEFVQFLEIDGHPALLSRINGRVARLWLFDDDYKNGCRSNTWNEVTIELPFYWGQGRSGIKDDYSVCFHSVSGTDFMILYLYRPLGIGDGYYHAYAVSQYSYNRKKEIFLEIEINGLPSSIPYQNFVSCVSTFAENLSPVQQLANNTQDLGKYVAPDL